MSSQVRLSTMATILGSIGIAVLLAAIVVTLLDAIIWLFISFFIAVVLNPIVERLTGRLPRWLAVVIVLSAVLMILAGMAILVVPTFATQVRALIDQGPQLVEKMVKSAAFSRWEERYHFSSSINGYLRQLPNHLTGAAAPVFHIVGGVFRLGLATVSIFFLVLFMLLGGQKTLRSFLGLLPEPISAHIKETGLAVYWSTTRYALGTGAIAVLAGGVATMTLAMAGVPYFLPLGVTMIFLDLVPVAGFITGGLMMMIITAATVGWWRAMLILVVFLVYQTLESHLLLPIVHRKTVRVSALGIVVALLLGLELAGILGVLFAVPVAGALRIIVHEICATRRPSE